MSAQQRLNFSDSKLPQQVESTIGPVQPQAQFLPQPGSFGGQQQPLQDEFAFDPRNQAFVQQQQQSAVGNFLTAQIMNYPRVNPCNPCQASPLHVSVQVVTKEEIEAPWRLECEYLQSVITQLESRRLETKIIEKVVEKEKLVRDTDGLLQLENQLSRMRMDHQQELMALRSDLSDAQRQNATLQNQLRQKDNEFSSFKGSEQRIQQLEAELNRLRREIHDRDAEINELRNTLHEAESKLSRYQNSFQELEQQIRLRDAELENKARVISQLQSSVSDSSKYREFELRSGQLESELNNCRSLLNTRTAECDSLRARLAGYEKDNMAQINQYRFQISDLEDRILSMSAEIEKLKSILRARDDEIMDLHRRIEELESQGTVVIQEKVTYLTQEVEVWKQKFIKLNKDYNQCQEELIMAQAELEAMKKRETKQVTVERSTRVVGTTSTTRQQASSSRNPP